MKLSKKISSFLLSSLFMLSVGMSQSKAEWITVGNGIDMKKVVEYQKSNWCWANSGAKMLECLGIKGKQAAHVAISAGHSLRFDEPEDISKTVWAVQNILPEGHELKNSLINYFICGEEKFGTLVKIDEILQIDPKVMFQDRSQARVSGTIIDCVFSESKFLKTSLKKRRPVLAKLAGDIYGVGHIVLITGIDCENLPIPKELSMMAKILFGDSFPKYKINKIRYWDPNYGEIEEDYTQSFAKKVKSYAGFDINA